MEHELNCKSYVYRTYKLVDCGNRDEYSIPNAAFHGHAGGGEDVRSTLAYGHSVDKQGSWKALAVLVVPSS